MPKFKFFSSVFLKIVFAMAIFHSNHENPDFNELNAHFEFVPSNSQTETAEREIHIFEEKLRVPKFQKLINRPRLTELLENSLGQFGATLISGRSGTGKTALAADFADRYEQLCWYMIQSPESDWEIFSKYFASCLGVPAPKTENMPKNKGREQFLKQIAFMTEQMISRCSDGSQSKDRLIVLDGVHHLFDSEWFTTFFYSLVGALDSNTHLLMLCRGTPSLPLWRLRSKQVLRVLDEKVLNFNIEETKEIMSANGVPPTSAERLQLRSFGRVSKLLEFIDRHSLR